MLKLDCDEQELLLWRSGLIVENVDLNTMYICSYHREYYSEHNQVRCCDPFLSHANIEGMTRKKKTVPKKAMIEIIMLQQYTTLLRLL